MSRLQASTNEAIEAFRLDKRRRCRGIWVMIGGRPAVILAIGVLAALPAPGHAADPDPGRIAIIDTAVDTRAYLPKLRAAGVKVIGRYLGRCPQWDGKRLIDNGRAGTPGSEIDAILDNGFAVLSIYQYLNNSAYKFSGKGYSVRTKRYFTLKDAACRAPANPPHTAQQEAELDAHAAVRQARAIGQPPGTAIYFAVDFNFKRTDAVTRKKLLIYFQTVNRIVKGAGYLLGAYGSGDALALLWHQNLVDFTWLSASRGYAGSSAFHNSGEWHLFQNWTDVKWFTKTIGGKCVTSGALAVDTNIQNKRFANGYIGFWNRNGPYRVPETRTVAIFDQRRFACNGDALIYASGAWPPSELASAQSCSRKYIKCDPKLPRGIIPHICYAHTVRLGNAKGKLVRIDYDDDGIFDGWTRIDNLSRSFAFKPHYIADQLVRRRALCPR
jgi:hypothetical protein